MDAEDAIEAVAFAQLNVPAVTALASVYQHVPENTPPPVLIIGDMDSDGSFTSKDGDDELVRLTLVGVISGEERRPLRALKQMVKRTLSGLTTSFGGWTLQFTFTGSDGQFIPSGSPDDQDSYIENFRFSVLALKQ
jgi:hypothetical protein